MRAWLQRRCFRHAALRVRGARGCRANHRTATITAYSSRNTSPAASGRSDSQMAEVTQRVGVVVCARTAERRASPGRSRSSTDRRRPGRGGLSRGLESLSVLGAPAVVHDHPVRSPRVCSPACAFVCRICDTRKHSGWAARTTGCATSSRPPYVFRAISRRD